MLIKCTKQDETTSRLFTPGKLYDAKFIGHGVLIQVRDNLNCARIIHRDKMDLLWKTIAMYLQDGGKSDALILSA